MIRVLRGTDAQRLAYGGLEAGRFMWCTDTAKLWMGSTAADREIALTAFLTFLDLGDTPSIYTGKELYLARVNSTPDALEFESAEEIIAYLDNFADAARHWTWIDDVNSGTITEAAGILTLAVAGAVDGTGWGASWNCPVVLVGLPGYNCEIITKLNSYTVNDVTKAGLYITDQPGGNNGIDYGRLRSGAVNGLEVSNMGVGTLDQNAITTLPIWLRIRVMGTGTGSELDFAYSTDGSTYTHQYTAMNENVVFAGLLARNAGAFNAISAPFEYFKIRRILGPG